MIKSYSPNLSQALECGQTELPLAAHELAASILQRLGGPPYLGDPWYIRRKAIIAEVIYNFLVERRAVLR